MVRLLAILLLLTWSTGCTRMVEAPPQPRSFEIGRAMPNPSPDWAPRMAIGRDLPDSFYRFPLLRLRPGEARISVVDATTGEKVTIGNPPPWQGPGLPHISGDGRWLIYVGYTSMGAQLILWDIESRAAYLPASLAASQIREPDLDATGRTLVYLKGPAWNTQLATFDVKSGLERSIDLPRDLKNGARTPSICNDGTRVAYVITGRRGDANLVILDLSNGRPITPPDLNSDDDDEDPALSPDGNTLLFSSRRNGSADIFRCHLTTGHSDTPEGVNTASDETNPRFLGLRGTGLAWVSTVNSDTRAFASNLEGAR